MVLAGLATEGVVEILDVHHIDRGYDSFPERLASLGADIKVTKDESLVELNLAEGDSYQVPDVGVGI